MAYKIFISNHTHRTEAEQLKKLHEHPELVDAPIYRPEDMQTMFRATTREKESDTYYVASIGCLARDVQTLEDFAAGCRARRACIASNEEAEEFEWRPGQTTSPLLNAWKMARVAEGSKAGGLRSAERKKAVTAPMAEKIRHLWCLPSREYSIKKLESISGLSRGALVSVLGNRGPAQLNYQAAQRRKERRNAKR